MPVSHLLSEEYLKNMIEIKLPGLHVMHAARNDHEIIVLVLLENLACLFCLFHYFLMFGKGNVLITVEAKQIIEFITVLSAVFKSLADPFYLIVTVTERTGTA